MDKNRDRIKEFSKKLSSISIMKVLAGALSLFLLSFLLSYALLGQDRSFDAVSRVKHWVVPSDTFGLAVILDGCENTESCYAYFTVNNSFKKTKREGDFLDLSKQIPKNLDRTAFVTMRFEVNVTDEIYDGITDALVINFPDIAYLKADSYWNGRFNRRAFNAERFALIVDKDQIEKGKATVDVVLEVDPINAEKIVNWHESFFIADNSDYTNYIKQLTLIQLGQGEQIGMIARIALAALMLLFFVILDGSESVLGLSLAMGFESAGMCFGNVSLKHQWITSSSFWNVTKLSFYCLSDFIGLYFLLYISGRKRFNIWFWLGVGAIVGLFYGITMTFFSEYVPWISSFWIPRVLSTSGVGIGFCIVAIFQSFRAKDRDMWKTVAIFFAIAGMGVVVIEAVGSIFPGFEDNPQVITLMGVGKSVKAYVLALSGLAAIASMRHELRILEAEREKARKMAHELQLGREMQQALLQVPDLPEGVEVSVSHVPAAYVSGDTYFFDWNSKNQVLTVLLNDVPGHGLQAALKAYACNVIAKTVWGQGTLTHDRRQFRSLFPLYQEQVVAMLKHQDDASPFNAFTGIEVFIRQQMAVVYRSNYNEALVISPDPAGAKIDVLSSRSGQFVEVPLKPGVCFLFLSDGLIPNSKIQKQFLDQLKVAFADNSALAKGELTSQEILNVMLDPQKMKLSDIDDDRTIIILRWNGKALTAVA